MSYPHQWSPRPSPMHLVHAALLSFPIACFTLAVLTDIAYWWTLNLLWLHFSEWLLLAGVLFGILWAIALLLDYAIRGTWLSWPTMIGGAVVLLLAILNNFIHTADGWTAVVPYGLMVSILTVLAMIATACFGRWSTRHV